jgi:hypothetical protein
MKKIIRKVIWPLYLAAIVFLTSAGFSSYLNASAILKDHTVLDAPIQLADTSSRTKRGHTTTTYTFNYSYTVADKNYMAEYSAVNEKGERYLSEPTIKIAYSNTDPEMVGALHVLERQSSFGGLLKRSLIGSIALGLVALFIYAWASNSKKENEGLEEPAKA